MEVLWIVRRYWRIVAEHGRVVVAIAANLTW
jgi:hypothetical protein